MNLFNPLQLWQFPCSLDEFRCKVVIPGIRYELFVVLPSLVVELPLGLV
jgi:hypothetical protein